MISIFWKVLLTNLIFFSTDKWNSICHCMHACILSCFSCVWLFTTLWTVACQAPPSRGFSRQEQWSGFSCPSPGDLPDTGIEAAPPAAPALSHHSAPALSHHWAIGEASFVTDISTKFRAEPWIETSTNNSSLRNVVYESNHTIKAHHTSLGQAYMKLNF